MFSILGIIASIVGIVLMASLSTALIWIPIITLVLFFLLLMVLFISECCVETHRRLLGKKRSDNFDANVQKIKELSSQTKSFFENEQKKKGKAIKMIVTNLKNLKEANTE